MEVDVVVLRGEQVRRVFVGHRVSGYAPSTGSTSAYSARRTQTNLCESEQRPENKRPGDQCACIIRGHEKDSRSDGVVVLHRGR